MTENTPSKENPEQNNIFPTKDEMKERWNKARVSFDKNEGLTDALLSIKEILDVLTANLLSS